MALAQGARDRFAVGGAARCFPVAVAATLALTDKSPVAVRARAGEEIDPALGSCAAAKRAVPESARFTRARPGDVVAPRARTPRNRAFTNDFLRSRAGSAPARLSGAAFYFVDSLWHHAGSFRFLAPGVMFMCAIHACSIVKLLF